MFDGPWETYMRLYEIVYIFDPDLSEDEVSKSVDALQSTLTEAGGEVVAIDHWGTRQLAYPIHRKKTGYYVVVQVRAEPTSLPDFEHDLRLEDDLIRYLIVVNEGEPIEGRSIVSEHYRSEGRHDDDDDEDDDDDLDDDDVYEDDADDGEFEDGEDVTAIRSGPPEYSGGQGRRRRMDGPPIEVLNYKDVSTLSRFMTEQGKILPKRTTKVSARLQRQLGRAVKRARYLALVPYVRDHEK